MANMKHHTHYTKEQTNWKGTDEWEEKKYTEHIAHLTREIFQKESQFTDMVYGGESYTFTLSSMCVYTLWYGCVCVRFSNVSHQIECQYKTVEWNV